MNTESQPSNTDDTNAAPDQAMHDSAAAEAALAQEALNAAGSLGQDSAEEIAKLQASIAELKDQVLRATAAAENTRRRADDDLAKTRKFAVEGFAESLLPVLDSMDAALGLESSTLEQMREGVQATQAQLLSALERNKVVAVAPAAGEKFDPNIHQAISMVPSEQEANTVVTVLQKGYTIAERVLRPALVTVSSGSAS
jgi:molecular chaperone GrpE